MSEDRAKIYLYAIIHHAPLTKEDRDNGASPKSTLVVTPTTVLARDIQEVNIIAARSIPTDYISRLSEVEIAVTPF